MNQKETTLYSRAFLLGVAVAVLWVVIEAPAAADLESTLFFIAILGVGAGFLAGGVVLAIRNVRSTPRVLRRTALILGVASLYFVVPELLTGYRAQRFLATADSSLGRVQRVPRQAPPVIVASFQAGSLALRDTDEVRPNTQHLGVGDSVWVYYHRDTPTRATIGRPEPNWPQTVWPLIWLWLVGSILLLGYSGRGAVQALFATAVVADLAFNFSLILAAAMFTPLDEPLADYILSAMLGILFTAPLALVIAGIGWSLRERRARAYVLTGLVLGAMGAGMVSGETTPMIFGAIAGICAGFTFRTVYRPEQAIKAP